MRGAVTREMSEWGHRSVLLRTVIEWLRPAPDTVFADVTLGAGGHAEGLLEASSPTGRVIGMDRDRDALDRAQQRLERFGERLIPLKGDFRDAAWRIEELGMPALDGVLMDLGVSSMQLDQAERGFSIQADGPLDMRMSRGKGVTAAQLVQRLDESELERIFREYGEEPRARAIARKIVEVRQRTRIRRTRELAELVKTVSRGGGRIHPATKVFQALRIAVNDELESLKRAIPALADRLAPGGRMVVIAFHSLEDRIVKTTFRDLAREGKGCVLTPKPAAPTRDEIRENPRARSARLRVFEAQATEEPRA